MFEYIGKRTPLAIRFSTVGKALNSLRVFYMCALRAVFALGDTQGCLKCFLPVSSSSLKFTYMEDLKQLLPHSVRALWRRFSV